MELAARKLEARAGSSRRGVRPGGWLAGVPVPGKQTAHSLSSFFGIPF